MNRDEVADKVHDTIADIIGCMPGGTEEAFQLGEGLIDWIMEQGEADGHRTDDQLGSSGLVGEP